MAEVDLIRVRHEIETSHDELLFIAFAEFDQLLKRAIDQKKCLQEYLSSTQTSVRGEG